MQTFLPFEDFRKCAFYLDDKRLYKQIVECKQILNTLEKKKTKVNSKKIAWENHPAVLMWEGYEETLKVYMQAMFHEWYFRRYEDCLGEIDFKILITRSPFWLGDEKVHRSHRAALFFKDPEYYHMFKDDYLFVSDEKSYCDNVKPEIFWPVKKGDDR